MKVKFSQSGGYAGLRRGCELDTDSLPSDEAAKLQSLVEQSGILQAESRHAPHARDLFNYNITIETSEDDAIRTVSFDDLSLPESAEPLLEYLQDCAKPLSK
ncbi:protealysin inhibitor emfourin [Pelatocladus sp. BLCC-F211]|uniref:protealysin inhibitor emfourin n=1 Tax=Pelatocladus sp. BLCC-F211 TaxID=3342752 RepID=UPI0035B6DD78